MNTETKEVIQIIETRLPQSYWEMWDIEQIATVKQIINFIDVKYYNPNIQESKINWEQVLEHFAFHDLFNDE
jgi:hypothetical protein